MTLHRDGDITYWSVYQQRTIREHISHVPDCEFAAMTMDETKRALRHLERHTDED